PNHCWVLGVSDQTIIDTIPYVEGSVLIGRGKYASYGWHYGHIDVHPENYRFRLEYPLGRDIVSVLVPHGLGSHVHFSWLGKDSYEEPYEQPGYFNPIDYLGPLISFPYNVAAFSPTDSGPCGAFASITGIMFAYEGRENVIPPQDRVREVIDILVRPYTYYYSNPSNDSCIVRKVKWRLLWQNPDSCEYQPHNSNLLGTWRTLYDFGGYIYDDNDFGTPLPEYTMVFWGGDRHWSNNICLTNTCETKRDTASFPGVETVWVDPYNRQNDYDDGEYCRGGWDTRLCTSDGGTPAQTDESAAFVDGRYAIEVMTFPQRFEVSKTLRILPVDDITLPEPDVTGIIVDNWAPRIYEICLKDNPEEIIRHRYYQIVEPNNPNEGRMFRYYNQDSWPYIGTGSGTNEYSLEIWYSEPVTPAKKLPSSSLTIKMVIGPDSSLIWESNIEFELDRSCLNPAGECEYALYTGYGVRPHGYLGNQIVELTIDSSFATDLAGNGLDADASTIVTALGVDSTSNYESTFTWIEPHEPIQGYYREVSDQDSRSNIIYANYDEMSTPPYELLKHHITLEGPLTTAELFHEVGSQSYTRCDIYGGTWMCDVIDDVLKVFIIDFHGNMQLNKEVFNFSAIDASGELFGAMITDVTFPAENPWDNPTCDFDRFGWLAWRKIIPPPDDGTVGIDEEYVENIELHVSVYDSYSIGKSSDFLVGVGNTWYDSLSMQWCETEIRSISSPYPGLDGILRVQIRKYQHPNITPVDSILDLDPPGTGVLSCNAITQDNVCCAELSPLEIEIDDYFNVFPNPVRGSLSIDFMTSEAVGSTVRIYDISGHLVKIVAEELPGRRNHNLLWDLQDTDGHIIPTGIYYVSLVSGSLKETRTVIVIH
ncbi:MAG: T9SS type A sorting domain-containing protein, partial [Candidatus Aegiribacteria sp.]|nr:T9SS type A sorting domain-containing protein [Candidatus Aegiribacteria sp.]